MATDLTLAILHHILAFGLVSLLMAEAVLLRPGLGAAEIRRLATLDAALGGTAVLLVIVGVLRVSFGLRGYEYYVGNHWFWAKMGTFVLLFVVSILPTIHFLRWRTALKANPAFVPEANDVTRMRRMVRIEGLLVLPLAAFAATMARMS